MRTCLAPARMAEKAATPIILASASAVRARLLECAGVIFTISPARVDEDGLRAAIRTDGGDGAAMAEALAVKKADQVSRLLTDALVIGVDQVLECDRLILAKPGDRAEARAQLQGLSDRSHDQISSVAVMQGGNLLWNHTDRARLTARAISDEFLENYLDAAGDTALSGPGAYQIEGVGAQLFSRIEGDYFTILGLPLIPLLDYLRSQQALET